MCASCPGRVDEDRAQRALLHAIVIDAGLNVELVTFGTLSGEGGCRVAAAKERLAVAQMPFDPDVMVAEDIASRVELGTYGKAMPGIGIIERSKVLVPVWKCCEDGPRLVR